MFRTLLLFFIFFWFYTPLLASGKDSASATFLKLIEIEKNPNKKIGLYHALAEYNADVNLFQALQFSRAELMLAQKSGNKESIAEAYIVRSRIFNMLQQRDSAWYYIQEAEKLASAISNNNLNSKILYQKGECFFYDGDLVNASDQLNRSYMQFAMLRDSNGMMDALYILSQIYFQQNDFKSAFHKSVEALAIATATQNKSMICNATLQVGNYFYMDADFDSALYYYNKALQLIPISNQSKLGQAYSNIGDVYVEKRMLNKALEFFLKAKPLIMQTDNKAQIAHIYTVFGRCYFFQKKYELAVPQFDSSIVICKQIRNFDLLTENYGFLSDLYAEQSDFKNALRYELLVEQSKDSLTKIFRNKELLKLQTQFEAFKKQRANELLTAQNKIAESKLARQQISILALSLSLILLTVVGLLLYRLYRQRNKNFHELEVLNLQLAEQKKSIEQLNTMLEIRAVRAQMDPHFLFNCMVSIQHLILSDEKTSAIQYLTKFSKLLRMVLENADNNTVVLQKEIEMLRLYLDLESIRFKDDFHFQIHVDDSLDAEVIELPTLLIQPFAENSLWHGLASKVGSKFLSINFNFKDDMLECVVEDNGIGRAQSKINNQGRKNHKSKAMQMIADRLNMIKQQSGNTRTEIKFEDLFDREKKPAGTRVVISLPLISNL